MSTGQGGNTAAVRWARIAGGHEPTRVCHDKRREQPFADENPHPTRPADPHPTRPADPTKIRFTRLNCLSLMVSRTAGTVGGRQVGSAPLTCAILLRRGRNPNA